MKSKDQKVLIATVLILLVAFAIWFWAFPWLSGYFIGLAEKSLTTINATKITSTIRRELSLAQFFDPRNPAPYYWQGYLASRNGDFKNALGQLTGALEKNLETARPDLYKDSLFRMGHTLAKLGDPERSALYYGEFLKRYGGKEPFFTYYRLAFLDFELLDKPEQARDLFETFKSLGPTSPPLTPIQLANYHHLWGRVKFYFGDSKGALNEANQALKYVDDITGFLLYRNIRMLKAVYLAALDDLPGARKEFDQADKILPNSVELQCILAKVETNSARNYKKTIEMAKPIVEANLVGERLLLNSRICAFALSRAYLGLKDKVSAKKYFELFKKNLNQYESAFTRRDVKNLTEALGL